MRNSGNYMYDNAHSFFGEDFDFTKLRIWNRRPRCLTAALPMETPTNVPTLFANICPIQELQQSGVQLSERLTSLGTIEAQFRTLLKPHHLHRTMVSRSLKGALT